ncbi:MAG: hypothetical protein AAF334_05110, partial [Pseudomonadota bacterium]
MRIVKWILIFWLSMVGALVAAFMAALVFLPRAELIEATAAALSRESGRNIEIAGPVNIEVWPRPGWRTGRIVIGGAAPGAPPLLEAPSALISIWPRALLQRDWRIAAIFFDQPRLTVTRSANGGWSIPTPELNADV